MSDTSQGPGWWRASDGRWYPPEAAAAAQPQVIIQQVPAKKGHGCLYAILAATGLVVLLIVAVAALGSSTSKKSPGPGLGSTTHPAADDVSVTSCTTDATLGFPTAALTIVNHSSKTSNYVVELNFTSGGTIVAQGAAVENNVAAGQQAKVEAAGDRQASGAVTCQIVSVTRLAA